MSERTLTDADVAAIIEAVRPIHECRFHVSQEEFESTWPVMREVAKNVEQAKSVSVKVVVTGIILFFLGAIGRGLWVWIAEMQAHAPK